MSAQACGARKRASRDTVDRIPRHGTDARKWHGSHRVRLVAVLRAVGDRQNAMFVYGSQYFAGCSERCAEDICCTLLRWATPAVHRIPPPPTEPGGCTNFGPSPPRSPATDILSVLLEVRPSLRRFSESLNKPCRAAILPLQQPLTHGCCYGLNERVVTRDLSSGRRMGERRLAIRSMCVFASRRPQL